MKFLWKRILCIIAISVAAFLPAISDASAASALSDGVSNFSNATVDNDSPLTSFTGQWSGSKGSLPYGKDSLWARDGATYTWWLDSQSAGFYDVYMWWSAYASRAKAVNVDLNFAGGKTRVVIDQSVNSGKWNFIGTGYFDSDGSVTIIAANGATVSTCADAVWFKPVSTRAQAAACIDAISPNPAKYGEPVVFKGHGTYDNSGIAAWRWSSDIDGKLSDSNTFTSSKISRGTHTISLRVQDSEGNWSDAAVMELVVKGTSTTKVAGIAAMAVKTAALAAADIIVDNNDTANTSSTGRWQVSSASGYYDTESFWSRNGATFTWDFTAPSDGQYEIFMWWTPWPSRATNIPVDITNDGTTARVYINQQVSASQWNSLGVYNFTGAKTYQVTLTSVTSETLSTCADAIRVMQTNGSTPPPSQSGAENIYICQIYSWNGLFLSDMNDMLTKLGAVKDGSNWRYSNTAKGITYNIRYVSTFDGMMAALAESNSHVIVGGHSNYGLAAAFATATEFKHQHIDSVLYIDDDRFLKCGSDMVSIKVDGMQIGQAYPNWKPIYKDGTSGIMPYDFSQGTPPYNYYITYRIPGDPIYYRVELMGGGYVERFPDSSVPAWYSPSGAKPNPSANPEYFITNPEQYYSKGGPVIGKWSRSSKAGIYGEDGYNGYDYFYRNAGTGTNSVTFICGINAAGRYRVSGSWFPQADHATNAEYIINHAAGTTTVQADQTKGDTTSFWNTLGTFNFNTGESTIIATDKASGGVVIADGILLTPVDNPTNLVRAEFRASTRTGAVGTAVQFTDYSTVMKSVQSRLWNFGDGTTSVDTNPAHTFTTAGIYTVSLAITDTTGIKSTETKTNYIAVGIAAPTNAEFYATGLYGAGRTTINFYDQSIGNITSRSWNFGNGTVSTATNPKHVYYLPGKYTVTLTVSGANGTNTHTETDYVYIGKTPIYCDSAFKYKANFYAGSASRPTPKTILKTRDRLQDSDLRYARLFWGTCNSSNYYLDTFHRGIMFYLTGDIDHYTGVQYLQGYLQGLSDQDILAKINKIQPGHEYYNFNSKPLSAK